MTVFCKRHVKTITSALLYVLFLLIVALLFSACGQTEPEQTTDRTVAATTAESVILTSTGATTEATTAETTEATTETTMETIAESAAPALDFSEFWTNVTDIFAIEVGLTHEVAGYNPLDMDIVYLLARGEGEMIERFAGIFSEPVTEYSEADAWWDQNSGDLVFEISVGYGRSHEMIFCQTSGSGSGKPTIRPMCYWDKDGVRYVFELEAGDLAFLEELVETVRIKSYKTAAEGTGSAGENGEDTVEIKMFYMNGLYGYYCDSVDLVYIDITSCDRSLVEELNSCFNAPELTPADATWPSTIRTLGIRLSDGRTVNVLYEPDIENGGYELDECVFVYTGEVGQTFKLSENAMTKLSALLEKVIVSYAEA